MEVEVGGWDLRSVDVYGRDMQLEAVERISKRQFHHWTSAIRN